VPRPEDRCPAEQKGKLIVPLGESFKKVISIGLGRDQGDRYNLMLRTMVVQGTARPAGSSLIVFRFQRPTKPSPSSASGQTATSNWCWTLDIDTICPRQRPGEVSYCTNDGCLFFRSCSAMAASAITIAAANSTPRAITSIRYLACSLSQDISTSWTHLGRTGYTAFWTDLLI